MPAPPLGQWASDPYLRHEMRYWDGRRWTEHVADHGVQTIDPLPEVRHAVQDLPEPPRPRVVPEATSLPVGTGYLTGSNQESSRSSPGRRLSGRTHLLLAALSCGLWLLAAPAVHLWQRGSRQLAGLWAVGATVLLVVAAAGAGSSPPGGGTAGTPQAGSVPSSETAGVRPLAAIPSSTAAQTTSAAPTTRPPVVTTPPSTTSRPARTSPSSRPTSRTSTSSRPKPSTTKPKPRPTSTGATDYPNCTAMHVDYPHGVGRPGAHDKTSGTPVTTFTVSAALYAANTESDRDGDGIACEKA